MSEGTTRQRIQVIVTDTAGAHGRRNKAMTSGKPNGTGPCCSINSSLSLGMDEVYVHQLVEAHGDGHVEAEGQEKILGIKRAMPSLDE